MIRKILSKLHKDNKGAALITVLVCVFFISILGTVLLFMSAQNAKMKSTDYNNKAEFYEAERVLELIETTLTGYVSDASTEAYLKTLYSYSNDGNATVRKASYDSNFYEEFRKMPAFSAATLADCIIKLVPGSSYTVDGLGKVTYQIPASLPAEDGSVIYDTFTIAGDITGWSVDYPTVPLYSLPETPSPDNCFIAEVKTTDPFTGNEVIKPAHFEIPSIEVTYTNSKGYVSVIKTSFIVEPPQFTFNASSVFSTSDPEREADCMECVRYLNWMKN